jgi:hypothetical protein
MNEQLIQDLTKNLEKSRKPWLPGLWLTIMLLLSIVSGSMILNTWGLRFDISGAMDSLAYRTELFLLLGLVFISYLMAAAGMVPGRARAPRTVLFGLLLLILALAALFSVHPESHGSAHWSDGWHCLALIAVNASLPTLVTVFFAKRRAAPTRPALTMAFILIGTIGSAVAVQHLICPYNETWHLVVWHLAILPGALLLARAAGAKILRW